MKKRFFVKRLLAFPLIALFSFGAVLPAFAESAGMTEAIKSNVALGKKVIASDDYVAPEGIWSAVFLTDGKIEKMGEGDSRLGWSTLPTTNRKQVSEVDLTIDLDGNYSVDAVALAPTKHDYKTFPMSYEIQLSADGNSWTTVAKVTDRTATPETQVHTFTSTVCAFVRVHITKNSPVMNSGSYLSQLGEIEINGTRYRKLVNAASGKAFTASASLESGSFGVKRLTDGKMNSGWSSRAADSSVSDSAPVELTMDLKGVYELDEIRLFPCTDPAYFPTSYEIYTSFGGEKWEKLNASPESAGSAKPQTVSCAQQCAAYVRIVITESAKNSKGGSVAQLSEIEIIGEKMAVGEVSVNKSALRMQPGESDKLRLTRLNTDPRIPTPNVVWTSDNESVAKIDSSGCVTAIGLGVTTLRGTTNNKIYTCKISVDEHSMLDNFMITTFRSPSKPYLTPETYDLLQAAGFTNIQNEWNTTVNTLEDNLLMAQYSYERGMDITASLGDWKDGFAGISYEEIQERISLVSHVPGVGGIYIIDEPYNANQYAPAFKAIKDLLPYADVHLNFLPMLVYPNAKIYEAQMNDLYQLSGGRLDYLMYDYYPFGLETDSFNEGNWYNNLDVVRKLGLKTGAKTGTFIQSISMRNGYRRPNGKEIRFEAYSAAAYGYKQLAYFCWETPNEVDYGFGPAIVDIYGKPTEIYEPVKEVNNEILKLGPTLMQLDSVNVYHAGKRCSSYNRLPQDFFIQPQGDAQLVISHMRNKNTDADYAMLVNRDLKNEQTVTFTVPEGTASIEEISNQTGLPEEMKRNADGSYTVTLRAGAGILVKMPASCNYTPNYGKFLPQAGENLALNANISGSGSVGADGFYLSYVQDGNRFSTTAYQGWDSTPAAEDDQTAWLLADLGGIAEINRVDLYPAGQSYRFGMLFPTDFTIDVSQDGENWKSVVTQTNFAKPETVPSFTFEKVSARYVRLNITGMRKFSDEYRAQIGEFEIYNDDGSVPAPKNPSSSDEEDKKASVNLASNATVICSSSYEEAPYWSKTGINDGRLHEVTEDDGLHCGWSSAINANKEQDGATEWIGYDFGKKTSVNTVIVYTARHPVADAFPIDFCVEVSDDGENWRTVYSKTGEIDLTVSCARTLSFDSVETRYLRFRGTKLSELSPYGYMMQLSELEVYNIKDDADKTELKAAVEQAKAIQTAEYTQASIDTLNTEIAFAEAVLADENASQEDVDAALTALNNAVKNLTPANTADNGGMPVWLLCIIIAAGLAVLGGAAYAITRAASKKK
ncbi:MAG: discoidin domain-containing protein [Clostridiales bacterium]|nr:discoidin domain-containing protein [Clostridiales bacterium]